jgi:hypothetical protein
MAFANPIDVLDDALQMCPRCDRPFIQPLDWEHAGDDHWFVCLGCASCGWVGERVLSLKLLDRLEEELDESTRVLELALVRITRSNMSEYCERFAAALEGNAILAEDF